MAIDGFFALGWFGWDQAAAPSWLVAPLAVGSVLAAALAVAGIVVTRRSARPGPRARRRYGIIVGLESGLLGAGAAGLAVAGQSRWIPVWICFGAATLLLGDPSAITA